VALDAFGVVNRSLFFLRERASTRLDQEISDARVKFAVMDDAQLRAACRSALQGRFQTVHAKPSSAVKRALLRLSGHGRGDDTLTPLVALGVEAFSRAPADLPPGSALFPEQISAAAALTTKTLVEMDTGEGKTYAILPAAFALCCARRRVYIVCASEYLAWRDASRTAAFWDMAGVPVGLAVSNTHESEWGARVVYTTLDVLIFKAMNDTLSSGAPAYPLTYDALLLDEADAILLDQTAQPYAIVKPLKASTYDWSAAFAFCDRIGEEHDIAVDRTYLSASLTEQGESALRAFIGADASPSQFLLLRYAVEKAYIALKIVQENVDFVAEDNRLHPVNRLTGRVERNVTPAWIVPLEKLRGSAPRQVSMELNARSASSFVSEFEQISGTSGTIIEDSIEFLLTYGLWTMRVEPRYRRHDGDLVAQIYLTKNEAHTAIVARALESHRGRRPVLIGCQTPADAEAIYARIGREAPEGRIALLSGRDDRHAADVFESAGQPESILVATQIAGRGVDIRLAAESRANGGLDLICAGHSLQRRHDRQFFGRAGRQGDPYTAAFYCSFDDELLVLFGARRIQAIMGRLGMEEGVPIESKMAENAIRRAQREQMYHLFIRRRANQLWSIGERESYEGIAGWFSLLQASRTESEADIDDELIDDVVTRFVDDQPILRDTGDILGGVEANALATVLLDAAGTVHPPFISARNIEGHTPANAKVLIKAALLRELGRRLATHRERLDLDARAAVVHFRLHRLRSLLAWRDAQLTNADEATEEPEESSPRFDPLQSDFFRDLTEGLRTLAANEPPPDTGDGRFAILSSVATIATLCEAALTAAAGGEPVDIEPLRTALQETMQRDSAWQDKRLQMTRRSLRRIVYWTLQWTWIEFLRERDRIRDRYAQGDLSHYDYYRVVADRSRESWEQLEQSIPAKIVRNLLASDGVPSLDQLFLLEDHADDTEDKPQAVPLAWSSKIAAEPEQSESGSDLVDRFITAHESLLKAPMTKSSLRRLLDDFLSAHPLQLLASPRQIQSALEAWSLGEVENGVESRRRKLRRRWLGDFLTFLRDERLIGALPTLRHRLVGLRTRALRRLGNTHTLLPLTIGLIVVAVIGLLAWAGDLGPPHQLTPFLSWVDAWMAGAAIARGNPLAPAAISLLIAGIATWALWPLRPQRVNTSTLNYLLVFSLAGAVALAMFAQPPSAGWEAFLLGLAKVAGSVFVTLLVRRLLLFVYAEAAFDLLSIWLLCSAIFVVLPRVIALQQWQEFALFGALLLGTSFVAHTARAEIEVVSVRVTESDDAMSSEQLTTSIEVRGHADFPPYLLGLVAAWATCELVTSVVPATSRGAITAAVPAVVYFAVSTLWTANVLKNRFALEAWKGRLNERHQVMVGIDSDEVMREHLDRLRQRLLAIQTVWHAAVISAAVLLLSRPVPGLPLAAGLFAVSVAAFIAFEGQRFLGELRSLSLGGAYVSGNGFDVNALPEPEEELGFWDRARRVMKTRMAVTIGVMALVLKFAGVLMTAWKLVGKVK
jgi:hypothetical protein